MIAGSLTIATAGTSAAAPTFSEFTQPGPHNWQVPANVCEVTVEAYGAWGGASSWSLNNLGEVTQDEGGLGALAEATITVSPGESLQVNVGGAGGDGETSTEVDQGNASASAGAGAGGANGGGDGGAATQINTTGSANLAAASAGGGGGGASDIRQGGTALADRVILAAGGGGTGGAGASANDSPSTFVNDGGAGGDAGHPDGSPGDDGFDGGGNGPGQGGGGGTQSAGGSGGTQSGNDGSLGTGAFGANTSGTGGDAIRYVFAAASGGGGGGYYGGGGGGNPTIGGGEVADGTGGGGGGSSFGPAGTIFADSANAGDGWVRLTYDPVNGGCPPPPTTTTLPDGPGNVDEACVTYYEVAELFTFGFIDDDPSPAELEALMTEVTVLLQQGISEAPPDIRPQWAAVAEAFVAIDEIYASVGYDLEFLTLQQAIEVGNIATSVIDDAAAVDSWAEVDCVPEAPTTTVPAARPQALTPRFTG